MWNCKKNCRELKLWDIRKIRKGLIYYNKKKLYITNVTSVKKEILYEYHKIPYAGQAHYQKLISTLRKNMFWPGMKKYVVDYLAMCLECQEEKVEHQRLIGLLNPLTILE